MACDFWSDTGKRPTAAYPFFNRSLSPLPQRHPSAAAGAGLTFMWQNRATRDVKEATEPDLEAEAAAIGRLRRVVGRADGRDMPEAATPAAAPDCFAGSGLTGNAFAVLGVGLDARAERSATRIDDLSFAPGQDPDALNAARAAVMSARDRPG